MLSPEQAKQLREAGLTAYNHNLDTSPEFYGKITTTRKYEDRLATLAAVRDAGEIQMAKPQVTTCAKTPGSQRVPKTPGGVAGCSKAWL